MTHIVHHQTHTGHRCVLELLAVPFVSIFNAMVWLAETNPKLKKIERLSQMSDEELAARGLRREEIVQSVLGPLGI